MERIEVKDVNSLKVASLKIQSSRSKEEEHFKQLFTWLKHRDIQPRKKLAIFHDKPYEFNSNRIITYEVCFEIKEPIENDERIQIKELPEQRMATITHHGPHTRIPSTYKTLLEWIKNEGYVVKGSPREVYIPHPNLRDKGDPKNYVTEIQFPIGRRKITRKLSAVTGSWMFPHLFVVFQWGLLLSRVMSFTNFPIIIPGSRANSELKVVMTSHLWVLLFSIALCYLFYKHKHRGVVDKWIFGVSTGTALFSVVNFVLHFVNDFLFFMGITEIIAWAFYLVVFATSVYMIFVAFLTSVLRRVMRA